MPNYDFEAAAKDMVDKVTPQIKDMAQGAMGSALGWLKEKADQTPNEWDNFFVEKLAGMLGMEIPASAPAPDAPAGG